MSKKVKMNYLFIVQGEGRGHLTQALALAAVLRRHGHEVTGAMVGKNPNRTLPPFFIDKIGCPVTTFDSPSFDYGKAGKRGNMAKTLFVNTTPIKLERWRKSIQTIVGGIEESAPDVVVNFYEMLLGVSSLLHRLRVPVVSIGHQFLVDHPDYKHRSRSDQGQFALRLNNMLCSLGTTKTLALSFYPMKDFYRDRLAVVPPLLRSELSGLKVRDEGYILGYVLNPAYADEVREWHARHPEVKLHLFWDKPGAPPTLEMAPGLTFHRIDDGLFLELMAGCSGYATTAGFESVCEAMWMGKPALLVPAHIEQEINAQDAAGIGAGVVAGDFDLSLLLDFIPRYEADTDAFRTWVNQGEELFVRHLTTLV
jgi:uncharacterized protein (TIGR00661 family)